MLISATANPDTAEGCILADTAESCVMRRVGLKLQRHNHRSSYF